MIQTKYQKQGAYHFGSAETLTHQNVLRLIEQFTRVARGADGSVLGGRQAVCRTELADIGRVVIKHYHRGGMLAHLNKRIYLKLGKPRCQIEFEQMVFARSIGVSTPEPVAFAHRGAFLYQAWLVTKEIRNQRSLALLSTQDPQRAASVLPALGEQVACLIDHHILHADFHPGNVLVDDHNQIFIIDFDKSRSHYSGSGRQLKTQYEGRWQRAVVKHNLPKLLVDGLRIKGS